MSRPAFQHAPRRTTTFVQGIDVMFATKAGLLATAATLLLSTAPALAQEAVSTAPAPVAQRQVDGSKILQLLVAKGVISQADADAITAQATVAPPMPAGGVAGDVQTIPYIPEGVRNQIKSELKDEVKAEAKSEGWAAPGQVPSWLGKVTLEGDIRVRDEEDLYDKSNDPNLVSFQSINTGAPFDLNHAATGAPNPPFLNATEDRNRPRVRARFGLVAEPDDWVSFEIRLATGNDSSPVSPNQTLGATGDFSKYSAWFDRFDLMLTPHGKYLDGLRLDLGRGENPFWTTALEFYPDLNFDGVSARYRKAIPWTGNLEGFATIGAFPIFNTSLNFSSNDVGAFQSRDEWLYAAQGGASWKAMGDLKLTGAVGYFHYDQVQGQVSQPCLWNQDVCNTDTSRTAFEQWGNSMMPIRTIVPNPAVAPGLSPDPQYFGLASPFHVLEVHAALDFTRYPDLPIRIEGEYLDNLAFDRSRVLASQVNVVGPYAPGGTGWTANLTLGKPAIAALGDWNVQAGYRYLESDATLDAIADADFHLGGTNAKGFVLMGYYGIAKNTSIGIRWFSADVITGPQYSNDVLQLDLNAKF